MRCARRPAPTARRSGGHRSDTARGAGRMRGVRAASPGRRRAVCRTVCIVHAGLFPHYHADHIFGLDDLRPIPHRLGSAVPLYCTHEVERKLRQAFAYAFTPEAESLPAAFVPKLTFRNIGE